jgi:RNA polymerase sigma-70 factor (ECF subfamily)
MNEKEFTRHYDALSDALFRHCYFRIYDKEKAKDITQEAFIKTWHYISKGNEIKNIKAFLYRTLNNLIVDETRKKQYSSLDELREEKGFEPSKDITESLQQSIDVKNILGLLEQLEQPYRDVFIMRYVDNLKPKEIASLIGESQNVVSVRIHRALEQLRNIIPHYNE